MRRRRNCMILWAATSEISWNGQKWSNLTIFFADAIRIELARVVGGNGWWELVIRDGKELFSKLMETKLHDFVSRQLRIIIKWSKMVQSRHFFRRSYQDTVGTGRGRCWMMKIGHWGWEWAVPKVDGEEIAWFCELPTQKYHKIVKKHPISPFFSQISSG